MPTHLPMPALLVLIASGQAPAVHGEEATFYVSPAGDDANPGSRQEPFRSIRRAQAAVRTRNRGMTADLVVELAAGTYPLDRTLLFGPEDSGFNGHSVIYRAAPGATVVLSGGRRVEGWAPDENGRFRAPVDLDNFRQFYVNGVRARRARGAPPADLQPWGSHEAVIHPATPGSPAGRVEVIAPAGYTTTDARLAEWKNPSDLEFGYFNSWSHMICRVQSITRDGPGALITMAQPGFFLASRKGGVQAGLPDYMENALELLDEPGEWYFDRSTHQLYYLPRPGEDLATAEVIAPRLTCLLEVQGTPERPVRNLHFQGLQWAFAEWFPPEGGYLGIQACHFTTGTGWAEAPWGRIPAALRWNDAEACSVTDGVIAHLGGCGVEWVARCRHHTLEGTRLFDLSGNGVLVGGPREEEDVPRDIRVANNHLWACGLDYYGAVGVWVGFAQRTVIAHNEVHDLPYTGISVGWQWNPEPTPCRENVIEYNHIYDVMNRLGDGGGIYTLGFQPGTVIRGNHIHDVHRSPLAQAAPNNGMFIDEGSKGFLFERNVIYRTHAEPVRFNQCSRDWHTWRDNHFEGEEEPSALEEAIAAIARQAGPEPPYRQQLQLE